MAKVKKDKKSASKPAVDQKEILSRSFGTQDEKPLVKSSKKEKEGATEYSNMLGGTLKIDDVIFPGHGSLPLTSEQTSTKRMKHAIECGVVVKA